ncbi:uncharacterized protein VICG_01604, partial [Vittaforma corneae ATCC 50505]
DMLLSERVSEKQEKASSFMHRIEPCVPRAINERADGECLGVNPCYGLDENETYFCDNKYDIIPEIYNGKNVADFIDPEIQSKLQQVVNEECSYYLREYDVMSPEERRLYEDCNNARIHANMMALFNKRASVPAHRKNPARQAAEFDLVDPAPASKHIVSAAPKPSRNKKVQAEKPGRYYDLKPRHIFRPEGSKHRK